jgi:3-methyladenine DNA glycosylase/8-oxoguanine DNA glycosylase
VSERALACPPGYDLRATFGPLQFGRDDPTMRFGEEEVWRATRLPSGPATVRYRVVGAELRVEAWGEGADAALEAAGEVAGLSDDVARFAPPSGSVPAALHDRHRGFRLARTRDLVEALLLAITSQAASRFEAHRAHRQLLRALGTDAPGPGGLRLSPSSHVIAGIAAYDLHTIGFEPNQADLLRRAAAQAHRLEGIVDPTGARAALQNVTGLTAGGIELVLLNALGDPDAVPTGDPLRARQVGEALAGDGHADDDRKLELLEPWRGQRGRVVRLVEIDGESGAGAEATSDAASPGAGVSPSLPRRSG